MCDIRVHCVGYQLQARPLGVRPTIPVCSQYLALSLLSDRIELILATVALKSTQI